MHKSETITIKLDKFELDILIGEKDEFESN